MTRQIKLLNILGIEIDPAMEASVGYLALWGSHPWVMICIYSKDRIGASYWRTEVGAVENHRPDFLMVGQRETDQMRFGFHS